MLYWSLILFILVVCSIWASSSKHNRIKVLIVYGILLFYFSSFRLGLGMDYEGYLNKMYWGGREGAINWINEPLITLFARFIESSPFTPLLYFMFSSGLTIFCLFSYYGRKENEYWLISIVIFTLLPILFFNTFNLVRQFSSTSLLFFSVQFIEKKRLLPYILCILLAASMHLTALILLPLFFFIDKKYNPLILIIGLIGLFVLFSLVYPMIEDYALLDERFTRYLDTDERMGASGMILLYNLMGLALLFKSHSFNTKYEIISVNLFFLFILFSDLSFVNYYFFRIAVYFSPAFAYVFPKLLGLYFGRRPASIISWTFSLLFFLLFISNNVNNPIVVPSGMLPISALWDTTQYQVVYSIKP